MWLTDNPWPPAIVLVVVAVILGFVWRRNSRMLFLTLAGLCLLLIPVVFIIESAIITPAEAVEQRIYDMRDAVVNQDIEATLGFSSGTAVREKLAIAAAMAIGNVQPDARITDVGIEVQGNGTVAMSHFRANATFTGNSDVFSGERHVPTRWHATWRKEGGQWKIFALDRLDPITGESISFLDPG